MPPTSATSCTSTSRSTGWSTAARTTPSSRQRWSATSTSASACGTSCWTARWGCSRRWTSTSSCCGPSSPATGPAPTTSCAGTSQDSSARSEKYWSSDRRRMPKVFFATDLHGSEVCWKKFLNAARFYDADVLICGGDMTGKAIVPIVSENGHFSGTLGGEHQTVAAEPVGEVEANIRRKGYYPLRMSLDRLHELDGDAGKRAACFQEVMLEGVERWMGMAAEKLRGSGIRCFVSPGNDDEMEVDEMIRRAELVELGEGRVVDVDGFSMISTGWSNPTPWNTHREESEEKLGERIESMASKLADPSRAIFNLHCPPYKSGLDEAPAIDADLKLLHGGRALRPVGSTAVRAAFDAFIYSFWSINLITLGLYGMSYVYWVPDGQLLAAIVIFGVLTTFLVITYAMLVSVMPRTGGDYAWQSRVLGGGLGFVLSITGWWFTLFLWAPIYANILVVQFFSPLAYTLGWSGVATFFTSQTGIFVSCLIVLAFVSIVVTMGMETYARIQKICFWIGLAGLAVVCGLLLFYSQSDFQNAFNREATSLFGAPANAYQGMIDAASKTFSGSSFSTFTFGPVLLLLPWLAFYLLWPNWGATLYGEVRGAKDIRKPFWSMFAGLWVTVAMVAIVVLLINKTIGWSFYQSANAAYWNHLSEVHGAVAPPVPIWPYPVMFAGFLVDNHLFQALLIIVMGLWFFGWAGTLFLSSTRVIFAAAFDRVLPSWAANISAKRRVPYGSLVLMIVPSLVVSAIYAYRPTFTSVFLDATAVLALTFFATVVAAIILPWRRKDLYDASPIANYKVAGVPAITIVGVFTGLFLLFMLYEWSFNKDNLYSTSFQSTPNSVYYFLATYIVAVVIYVVARVVRNRQGIDLRRIHHEIPVE